MLDDQVSLEVVRVLTLSPTLSQRSLAAALGVSLGKVNRCIRALIGSGYVKAESYRTTSNKLSYRYLVTPLGVSAKTALARCALAAKLRQYDELGEEIELLRRESGNSGRGEGKAIR
jgi:EPS-associated MarR family transcriptional regulator